MRTTSPGEPFFDENGEATAAVQAVMQMLAALDAGRISTQRAVATLAQSDILEPWPLKLRAEEGEKELPGLYRVNEAGLAELSNESFLRLRGTDALPVAYAQLLSMTQVSLFPQLARIQAQLAPRPTPSPEVPENLDDVFGLAKDESIKFDF